MLCSPSVCCCGYFRRESSASSSCVLEFRSYSVCDAVCVCVWVVVVVVVVVIAVVVAAALCSFSCLLHSWADHEFQALSANTIHLMSDTHALTLNTFVSRLILHMRCYDNRFVCMNPTGYSMNVDIYEERRDSRTGQLVLGTFLYFFFFFPFLYFLTF